MSSYSIELEELIDLHTSSEKELVKEQVFEGVSYMLNGKMCFGVYNDYLVLRYPQHKADSLIGKPGISAFEINGKPLKGWLQIAPIIYRNPRLLRKFLARGLKLCRPPQDRQK